MAKDQDKELEQIIEALQWTSEQADSDSTADEWLDLMEHDIEQLSPVMQSYVAVPPAQEETDRLLAALRPQFRSSLQQKRDSAVSVQLSANIREQVQEQVSEQTNDPFFSLQHEASAQLSFSQLLRLQWYVYHKRFFMMSLLLLILLSLLSGSNTGGIEWLWEVFPWTIPVYMGAGLLYGMKSSNHGMRQLELVTPYPPQLQFMARIFLMYGFSIVIGLGGSLSAFLFGEHVSFIPFVLNWLAPATLVMGLLVAIQYKSGIESAYRWAGGTWLVYMLINQLSYVQMYTSIHAASVGIALIIGFGLAAATIVKMIRTGLLGRKVTAS